MKNKICILVIMMWNITISISQDYHISQFDSNPLYLNPGLTGERLNTQKGLLISANYRNQSSLYTYNKGAFNSIAVGLDFPLNNRLSIGHFISNNSSVDRVYNSLNLLLSGSYKVISSKDNNDRQNLSVGLQVGLLNNSFNTESFTYANQYSPSSTTGFDITIPSGEAYSKMSFLKLDYNLGVYYRTKSKNQKLTIQSGFSIYHIGEKNNITNTNNTIGMRKNLHTSIIYKVNDKVNITPQVLYMNQYKINEINVGTLMNYTLKTEYESIIGISLINLNATVLHLGMVVKGTTIRASYSISTNSIRTYSNKGLEFSIKHILNKNEINKNEINKNNNE